jgi:hypothetical protein
MNAHLSSFLSTAIAAVALLSHSSICTGDPSMAVPNDVLVFRHSQMKMKIAGVDAKGAVKYSHYDGKTFALSARVTDVMLAGNSPSIAIENSKVRFALDAGQTVPGHPGCRVVEVQFDEHGILEKFAKDAAWQIVLSDRAELVHLRPVPKTEQKTDVKQ